MSSSDEKEAGLSGLFLILQGYLCPFRHEPAAKDNEVVCRYWSLGACTRPNCSFRHMEVVKPKNSINCYWESQPSGCLRPQCPFAHSKDKEEFLKDDKLIISESIGTPNGIVKEIACKGNLSDKKSSIRETLMKKHLLEQQLFILQMKQKAAEDVERKKKELSIAERCLGENADENMDDVDHLSSKFSWESSSSQNDEFSPVSASPVHTSILPSFVVNIRDSDDSDIEVDVSRAQNEGEPHYVKTVDEIKLSKIQAEQESCFSYGAYAQLPFLQKTASKIDLREKIKRNQTSKSDEGSRKQETHVKTIQEIRTDKIKKEKGALVKNEDDLISEGLKRTSDLVESQNSKRAKCDERESINKLMPLLRKDSCLANLESIEHKHDAFICSADKSIETPSNEIKKSMNLSHFINLEKAEELLNFSGEEETLNEYEKKIVTGFILSITLSITNPSSRKRKRRVNEERRTKYRWIKKKKRRRI
ncbi:zinc finger CCCH domain-containing protein 11B-like isoform X3 [Artemia franciscana]|uniref:zinc finger CCCH domain-containing protein 11B-like isoform X3 n=1 Tax=Artemia franciscana TaxID=6661 RepID=UPI0032DB631A